MRVNLCIHAANILLMLVYSVKEMLWLRLCSDVPLIAISYFLLHLTPQGVDRLQRSRG